MPDNGKFASCSLGKSYLRGGKPFKEFLNEGSGRQVFSLSRNSIIKVAKNEKGLIENKNEVYIYKTICSDFKPFLCPVLYYRDNYIIMPKAIPLPLALVGSSTWAFEEVLLEHKSFIDYLQNRYGLDDFDLSCSFNWGILQNKIVLLDYGTTCFETEIYI